MHLVNTGRTDGANEARNLNKHLLRAVIMVTTSLLGLGACATNAPAPKTLITDDAEPVSVSCTEQQSCDSTLKQQYQYYLGLWSTIFLN